jgi:hypothetical protein
MTKTQHDRLWSEYREGERIKAKVMTLDELVRFVPKLREAGVGRAMNDLTTREDE